MFRQAITTSSRAFSMSALLAAQRTVWRPQFCRAPIVSARAVAIHPSLVRRLYSAETESKPAAEAAQDTAAANKDEAENPAEVAEPDAELKKKLEAKEAEARDWKDKYLRSVAQFRNLQDRTDREMKSARNFAIQKFATDLIDSVENLDRALGTVPQEKLAPPTKESDETATNDSTRDLVNLFEGLKMTETNLMQTLKKHGLERFNPVHEKFDPNEHEAIFMAPQPEKEDNTVFFVQQKGFKLNGRVIRPAKVSVVKNNK